MPNDREAILARVRHPERPARPLPAIPRFATGKATGLDAFRAALERMGGRFLQSAHPAATLRDLFPNARVVVSAAAEIAGTRPISPADHPARLADVDVAVVRARLGVAETGSVLLTERELVVNAAGFLPQHLVVLLDPARLVATLHDAYADPAFATARYAVLMTGPSATADIEGVLIHGAQGVRSLTVVVHPPRAP